MRFRWFLQSMRNNQQGETQMRHALQNLVPQSVLQNLFLLLFQLFLEVCAD